MGIRFSSGAAALPLFPSFSIFSFIRLIDERDISSCIRMETMIMCDTVTCVRTLASLTQKREVSSKLSLFSAADWACSGFAFNGQIQMVTNSPEMHGIIIAGHSAASAHAARSTAPTATGAGIIDFGHFRFGFLIAFRGIAL